MRFKIEIVLNYVTPQKGNLRYHLTWAIVPSVPFLEIAEFQFTQERILITEEPISIASRPVSPAPFLRL